MNQINEVLDRDTFFISIRGYFPPKMYVYDDKKKIILYAEKLVNLDNNLFAAFMGMLSIVLVFIFVMVITAFLSVKYETLVPGFIIDIVIGIAIVAAPIIGYNVANSLLKAQPIVAWLNVNKKQHLFKVLDDVRSGFFSKPAYKVIDNDGQLLATIKGDCLCYINGYLLCRIKSDSIIHSFLNRRFLIVKDSDVIGILTREFNIFRSNYILDMSGDLQKSIDRRIILSIVFIFILSIYHSSSGD